MNTPARTAQYTGLVQAALAYGIPAHTVHPLVSYLVHRTQVGSFLQAVLTNDLIGAVEYGDALQGPALPIIVRFLKEQAPVTAWGSRATHLRWMERRDQEVGNDTGPPLTIPVRFRDQDFTLQVEYGMKEDGWYVLRGWSLHDAMGLDVQIDGCTKAEVEYVLNVIEESQRGEVSVPVADDTVLTLVEDGGRGL